MNKLIAITISILLLSVLFSYFHTSIEGTNKTISKNEIKNYYNLLGKWLDLEKGTVVDKSWDILFQYCGFNQSTHIFEFGCGTGRFATKLFSVIPQHALYDAVDMSETMINLTEQSLEKYSKRINITLSDGMIKFDKRDATYSHFVSNFVLDLLNDEDINKTLGEAYRMLKKDGKMCLTSLGYKNKNERSILTSLWLFLYHYVPNLLGGCRPINIIDNYLPADKWKVTYHEFVSAYGLDNEVLIAAPKGKGRD